MNGYQQMKMINTKGTNHATLWIHTTEERNLNIKSLLAMDTNSYSYREK